jgi:hypothetical protein
LFRADEVGADDAVLVAVEEDEGAARAAFGLEVGVVF